jgi:hypothetical protein
VNRKNGTQSMRISKDLNRGFTLETPLPETDAVNRFIKLFPPRKSISLFDLINHIHERTGFLAAFKPFDGRKINKPEAIYLYAGLLERTTRNNFAKLAEQVGDIDEHRLEDTARMFFAS